ncbi:MAG TPA: cupredoxin domain-containing protein [Streptosporangiaceae bacterium]
MAGLAPRILVAAGLAVDAYVHADLAPAYDGVRASISQGDLFRIEAGLAAAAALIVLVVGRRTGFGLAFAVAASALGALLLYRYADVGRLGPLPNMYEPSWFAGKTIAAVAEAVAAAAALAGLCYGVRRRETAGGGRRRLALTMAGGAVAGVAVAGFTGQGTGAPAVPAGPTAVGPATAGLQQVTIMGNNALRFAPMTVHLHTGKVRITLQDSGAYPHNIVIPALHVTSATVTGDPGGARISFTVTFARPGRFAFSCQYHASAGMTGVFVVS